MRHQTDIVRQQTAVLTFLRVGAGIRGGEIFSLAGCQLILIWTRSTSLIVTDSFPRVQVFAGSSTGSNQARGLFLPITPEFLHIKFPV